MKKTVQLGLRIDEELLRKIEKIAEEENIDKMSWIRRALATFLKGEEEGKITEAVEAYIELSIDEDELKRISSLKKIPQDIQNARKHYIDNIKRKAKNDK